MCSAGRNTDVEHLSASLSIYWMVLLNIQDDSFGGEKKGLGDWVLQRNASGNMTQQQWASLSEAPSSRRDWGFSPSVQTKAYSHQGGLSVRDLREMEDERTFWGMYDSTDGWLWEANMAVRAAETTSLHYGPFSSAISLLFRICANLV